MSPPQKSIHRSRRLAIAARRIMFVHFLLLSIAENTRAIPLPEPCPREVRESKQTAGVGCSHGADSIECREKIDNYYELACDESIQGRTATARTELSSGQEQPLTPPGAAMVKGTRSESSSFQGTFWGNRGDTSASRRTYFATPAQVACKPSYSFEQEVRQEARRRFDPSSKRYEATEERSFERSNHEQRWEGGSAFRTLEEAKFFLAPGTRSECTKVTSGGSDGLSEFRIDIAASWGNVAQFLGREHRTFTFLRQCRRGALDEHCRFEITRDGTTTEVTLFMNDAPKWDQAQKDADNLWKVLSVYDCTALQIATRRQTGSTDSSQSDAVAVTDSVQSGEHEYLTSADESLVQTAAAGQLTVNQPDDCPDDPDKLSVGQCGCGTADTDSDLDTTPDCHDACPLDAGKTESGICGCYANDVDSDGDGIVDCQDECPADSAKGAGGLCGCGTSDSDSDGDTIPDCNDECPLDSEKTAPGRCGCGVTDADSDGDLFPDCEDECSADAAKLVPGVCGCGAADTDSDTDGTPDCSESCPFDPAKTSEGLCGCGIMDIDSNGDAIIDCFYSVAPALTLPLVTWS